MDGDATGARYAIYFAPDPASPLGMFGRRWLGRDYATGEVVERPVLAGVDNAFVAGAVRGPAHYGFHATLKPPFALAAGQTHQGLCDTLTAFAASTRAFSLPPLVLRSIDGFLALVPPGPSPALNSLADACVGGFDQFRAPPSPAELEQRRAADLTPVQDALLLRWGYPYVMAEFRFHMTLTGRLPEPERECLHAALAPLVAAAIGDATPIDAVALFMQPARDRPFRMLRRFPLDTA